MSNNRSDNAIKINDVSTINKAHQILTKEIKFFDQDKKFYNYKYELNSDVNLLNYKKKKIKLLRQLTVQLMKKTFLNLNLKRFYKAYKLLAYSFFLILKLSLLNGLNKLNKISRFQKVRRILYSENFYPKLLKINLTLSKICSVILKQTLFISKYTINLICKKLLQFTQILIPHKNFLNIESYFLLKSFYKIDTFLLKKFNSTKISFERYLLLILKDEKFLHFKKIFFSKLVVLKKPLKIFKDFQMFLFSIEDKQIKAFFERIFEVFRLYFIPFIFLATQAFVPLMEEYEYIIVNPFANIFLGKIPFLPQLIKTLRPIIKNPLLLFWAPLAYLLIFPLNYKSLKIPYKVAFNGTVALVFLIINYSCVLMQFLLRIIFESSKIIKDIFFTSYLIKHMGKSKSKKDKDQVLKIFVNLVNRYDLTIQKSYYEFLLLINHRFFSYLALISLAALLYNCTYYVIYNENPKIIIITKAVLGTIKNPQDDKS